MLIAMQRKCYEQRVRCRYQKLLELDDRRRELMARVEDLRARRNENSAHMKAGGKPDQAVIEEGSRSRMSLLVKRRSSLKLTRNLLTYSKSSEYAPMKMFQ